MAVFEYKRRRSSSVSIGNTPLGGDYPIRIQSMTNTSTMDTEACISQSIRIIEAGGEYVRLTAQGVREAENLQNIKDGLRKQGYQTPLIADIHFNPNAAFAAAGIVEKVRINPGNFVDPVKSFRTVGYTDEAYRQEIEKIRERFIPFLKQCKEHRTAIRIGVNHGSLSDRIMSRYGDTPEGMVESCMEFLRICVEEDFQNVVISMKASNTRVMVTSVRLLVLQMKHEGMAFPLHLGVTEAGDGEDGRIKSAVGIGTLLLEGIGDTVRVSLSEDPEAEIPVAKALVDYVSSFENAEKISCYISENNEFPSGIARKDIPLVIADYSQTEFYSEKPDFVPDFIYIGKNRMLKLPENRKTIVDCAAFSGLENEFPLFTFQDREAWENCQSSLQFVSLNCKELNSEIIHLLKQKKQSIVLLSSVNNNIYEQKAAIYKLLQEEVSNPVILQRSYLETDLALFQIKSATDCGAFFLDRLADGVFLQNKTQSISMEDINSCSFGILQATGRRISKAEYISCPSCGRTLFDLQTTLKKIKAATSHLKGLKIGVMGCIVNGPGEMADADYGYVGAGIGKVSLYKGKQCIKKNIPEAEAVDELLKLISFSASPERTKSS